MYWSKRYRYDTESLVTYPMFALSGVSSAACTYLPTIYKAIGSNMDTCPGVSRLWNWYIRAAVFFHIHSIYVYVYIFMYNHINLLDMHV